MQKSIFRAFAKISSLKNYHLYSTYKIYITYKIINVHLHTILHMRKLHNGNPLKRVRVEKGTWAGNEKLIFVTI